jgi:hypothetical protein
MQPMYVPENAVPPEDVRFEEITVEPWPDTRRVRVRVGITPFTSPPNLRVEVIDPNGQAVTSAHIVETINHRMVFTLHLRSEPLEGNYTLSAEVYYPDIDPVDRRSTQFQLLSDSAENGES